MAFTTRTVDSTVTLNDPAPDNADNAVDWSEDGTDEVAYFNALELSGQTIVNQTSAFAGSPVADAVDMASTAEFKARFPSGGGGPVVVTPTGVQPGQPGTFTPAGSDVPADLAALVALGDFGQTVDWAPDAFVALEDGTFATWRGGVWESVPAGAGPANRWLPWSRAGSHQHLSNGTATWPGGAGAAAGLYLSPIDAAGVDHSADFADGSSVDITVTDSAGVAVSATVTVADQYGSKHLTGIHGQLPAIDTVSYIDVVMS